MHEPMNATRGDIIARMVPEGGRMVPGIGKYCEVLDFTAITSPVPARYACPVRRLNTVQ